MNSNIKGAATSSLNEDSVNDIKNETRNAHLPPPIMIIEYNEEDVQICTEYDSISGSARSYWDDDAEALISTPPVHKMHRQLRLYDPFISYEKMSNVLKSE